MKRTLILSLILFSMILAYRVYAQTTQKESEIQKQLTQINTKLDDIIKNQDKLDKILEGQDAILQALRVRRLHS